MKSISNLMLSVLALALLATPCLAQDSIVGLATVRVPEPAIGLLLLVGGGFVAARRLRGRK